MIIKIIKKVSSGFTLIELLVVIAIIGSLSALFLPNFMAARERARDSQRKSDLRQIQKAFEMFRQDQTTPAFPATWPIANQCWSSGGSGATCPAGNIYMNKFPTDPVSTQTYGYAFDNSNLTYTLAACLENTADPDKVDCPVVAGFTCTSPRKCYIVNQP